MDELPRETLLNIFQYLSQKDVLLGCSTVNKKWYETSSSDLIWGEFFKRRYGQEGLSESEKLSAKEQYLAQCSESRENDLHRTLLQQGEEWKYFLYKRTLTKALPQIMGADQPNKLEVLQATYELLQPIMERKLKFKEYYGQLVQHITAVVDLFNGPHKMHSLIPSKRNKLLRELLELLDTLIILEALVQSNPFGEQSLFHRAKMTLGYRTPEDTQTFHGLYLFFGAPEAMKFEIVDQISKGLTKSPLYQLVSYCQQSLVDKRYLTRQERDKFVRLIHYSKNLTRPMFPELETLIGESMRTCENLQVTLFEDLPFPVRDYAAKNQETALPNLPLESYRQTYSRLYPQLQLEITQSTAQKKDPKLLQRSLFAALKESLELLRDISCSIGDLITRSYRSPKGVEAKEISLPNSSTAREVDVQFTANDQMQLLECLSILKRLSELLLAKDSILIPAIRSCIGEDILLLLHKTKLNLTIDSVNRNLRSEGEEPENTTLMWESYKLKTWLYFRIPSGLFKQQSDNNNNDKTTNNTSEFQQDIAFLPDLSSTGPTNMEFLQLLKDFADDVSWFAEKHKDTDLAQSESKRIVQLLRDYANGFYWYNNLLHLQDTLHQLEDISFMMSKEHFLNIFKRMLPVTCSFPYSLMQTAITQFHCVDKYNLVRTLNVKTGENPRKFEENLNSLETVQSALETTVWMYNIHAFKLLSVYKEQFLFDELSGEVELFLKVFNYKLAETIYNHFVTLATNSYLTDEISNHNTDLINRESDLQYSNWKLVHEGLIRALESPLELLGRMIDFPGDLDQNLYQFFQAHVSFAADQFTLKGDVCSVVQLCDQIAILRQVANLICARIKTCSSSLFSQIMDNKLQQSSPTMQVIKQKILREIVVDLLPHFEFDWTEKHLIRKKKRKADAEEHEQSSSSSPANTLTLRVIFQTSDKEAKKLWTNRISGWKGKFGLPSIQCTMLLLSDELKTLNQVLFEYAVDKMDELEEDIEELEEELPLNSVHEGILEMLRSQSPGNSVLALVRQEKLAILEDIPAYSLVLQDFIQLGNILSLSYLMDSSKPGSKIATDNFFNSLVQALIPEQLRILHKDHHSLTILFDLALFAICYESMMSSSSLLLGMSFLMKGVLLQNPGNDSSRATTNNNNSNKGNLPLELPICHLILKQWNESGQKNKEPTEPSFTEVQSFSLRYQELFAVLEMFEKLLVL